MRTAGLIESDDEDGAAERERSTDNWRLNQHCSRCVQKCL